jgi:hypothetical chaperone protein
MYGIDFGTSNTVVTFGDGSTHHLLEMDEGAVLPSLLFFERNQLPSIGEEARQKYTHALDRYRGRSDLYSHFRFFQALKLALKDPSYKGTSIFGSFLSAEGLVGMYLKELRRKADLASGDGGSIAVMGRPVVLVDSDQDSEAAVMARYRNACERAGFDKIRFVMEPVAAMANLIGHEKGNALVFDFGGGTLDISVARLGSDSIELLSTVGQDLGGYLLNEDISRAKIIHHFGSEGKFRTMKGSWLAMPKWITDQVASFYTLPLSDIAATRRTIKDLLPDARAIDRAKLEGLMEFMDKNQSFKLFETIDDAKIHLSSHGGSTISFNLPPRIQIREPLVRVEFESIIAARVVAARNLVINALSKAGLEPGDIATVVRVGGSSRVPVFVEMLENLFPGCVQEGEVFTSIASGLLTADRIGLSTE